MKAVSSASRRSSGDRLLEGSEDRFAPRPSHRVEKRVKDTLGPFEREKREKEAKGSRWSCDGKGTMHSPLGHLGSARRTPTRPGLSTVRSQGSPSGCSGRSPSSAVGTEPTNASSIVFTEYYRNLQVLHARRQHLRHRMAIQNHRHEQLVRCILFQHLRTLLRCLLRTLHRSLRVVRILRFVIRLYSLLVLQKNSSLSNPPPIHPPLPSAASPRFLQAAPAFPPEAPSLLPMRFTPFKSNTFTVCSLGSGDLIHYEPAQIPTRDSSAAVSLSSLLHALTGPFALKRQNKTVRSPNKQNPFGGKLRFKEDCHPKIGEQV